MFYSEDKSGSLMDRDICQYEPIDQPHIHEQVPLLSCIDEDLHSENYNVALDSTNCDELLALDSTTCEELVADEDQGSFITDNCFLFFRNCILLSYAEL